MNPADPDSPQPPAPRPLGVWIVSGWYFMSGFFSISMIAAVQSRLASKPATVETVSAAVAAVPVVRLETGDLLLAALLIALNLSAAGFLFLLKKTSVLFFKAALAVNVGTNVWYLFHRGPGTEPGLLYIGVVMGWLVAAAVCRYAANLERKGVLR